VGQILIVHIYIVYLTNLCVNWALFGMSGPTSAKKSSISDERVEYKVVLFDKSIKGYKLLNSSLFDEFVRKLGLFWHEWTILKRE
jgi:hypothetical protein